MKQWHMNILMALALGWTGWAGEPQEGPLYEIDFEQSEVGTVPDDFLVIDGEFKVGEENGNKFLELPGAPLDTFSLLFGPAEKENIAVTARIHGTQRGRRFPAFGAGLNGGGGYRLLVTPAKKAVELLKGDMIQTSVPYEWKNETWTELLLQVRSLKEGEWKVEGKVWESGQEPPKEWTITWEEKEDLWAGKASIIGSPFSGTPIRFDDLKVLRVQEQPEK